METALTLSSGQLQEWTDEIARIDAATARLAAEREAIVARIQAVRLLFGADAAPNLTKGTASSHAGGETLTSFIRDRINEAEQGIALTEIAGALRSSPLADKFDNNPNSVYTIVARLVDRREAVREGRMVYSVAVYERVKAGLVEKRVIGSRDGSVPALILSAMKRAGKALTSGEILDLLRQDEEMAARLTVNPQIGYTAISRLLRKERIVRVGGKRYLPATEAAQDA